MPRVPMRTLYEELAPAVGMEPRQLEYYGRFLREAHVLDAGRPGRGGSTPEASTHSAAALVVAIVGSNSAVGAGDAVNEFGSMSGDKITIFPTDADQSISLAPKGTFLGTVEHILDKMGDEQDGSLWRQFVREIGAVTINGPAYAVVTVGTSSKTLFLHRYQRPGDDGRLTAHTGLVRETKIGAETLHRIAELVRG